MRQRRPAHPDARPGWPVPDRPSWLWPVTILATAATGAVDYWTGPYIYLTDFYMGPILALQWYVGTRSAIVLTLAVMGYRTLLYGTVWRIPGPELAVMYWNLFSEAGFIVLIVFLMARLQAALRSSHQLAMRDPLTGVANRRAFYDQAERAIRLARRPRAPLSILYMDVDDFKRVNDRFGHHQGDRVLTTLAMALQQAARDTDLVARLGGDEFAVLLPETATEEARVIGHRLHEVLAATVTTAGLPCTFSIGAMTFETPPHSVDDLVARADALMYRAKQQGKNTVVFATTGDTPSAA